MNALNSTGNWKSFQFAASKYRVIVSLLLSSAFILAGYTLFGLPIYETNDDVGMSMISAGVGFVDRPDDHLMFMHFALGRVLNTLYSALPAVPWFALLQVGFIALAMTVVASILFQRIPSARLALALCAVLAVSVFIRPLQLLQFTTTAALVASAGTLLFIFGLESPLKRSIIWRFILPSLALIALATVIRERSAYLILVLSAVALTARHLFSFKWKKLLVGWVWLFLATTLSLGITYTNDAYYDRGPWKGFYALERITMPMRDYRHFQITSPRMFDRLKRAGWSPLDLVLFQYWYVLDEKKFSLEKFQQIASDVPLLPIAIETSDLSETVTDVLLNLTLLPATVALGGFAWLARRQRLNPASMLSYSLGLALVLICMILFCKLPERLYASMLGFSVLFFALYFSPSKLGHFLAYSKEHKTISPKLVTASFLLPVVLSGIYYRYRDIDTSQQSAVLRQEIKKLAPTKDDLYIVWATSFPFEAVRPFDNLHDYFDDFNLVWIAAYNRCPFVVDRLRAWGVDDLLSQFDRKNVHLISMRDTNTRMTRWILNSCGKQASFQRILDATDTSILQAFDVVYDPPEPLADNSPSCPVLKASDLILYPADDVQIGMHDTSVSKERASKDSTTFVIGSTSPKLVFKPPQAVDPNQFSHFGIQMSVNPWAFLDRYVTLKFKLSNGEEKMEVVSILPDGKMHSYSHNLKAFRFSDNCRIESVELEPRFKRADIPENSFDLKCTGFTRGPRALALSIRESKTK